MWFCPHCKDIAKTMVGRDLPKQERIIDEGSELIHGLDQGFSHRGCEDCRVIRCIKALIETISRLDWQTAKSAS